MELKKTLTMSQEAIDSVIKTAIRTVETDSDLMVESVQLLPVLVDGRWVYKSTIKLVAER